MGDRGLGSSPGIAADDEWYDEVQTVHKGHGRRETRRLRCLRGQCTDWNWPDSCQVIERSCTRTLWVKGVLKQSVEVSYGLTSLPPEEVGAAGLEQLWRGHWTIENRKHYVRDVTMGEDRHPMYRGTAPQALAALRNGLIDLWRSQGWRFISDAIRSCATSLSIGVDACLETSETVAAQRLCIVVVRHKGQVALIGECGDDLAINASRDFIRKGIILRGQWHYNLNHMFTIMKVIQSSPAVAKLITHVLPMSNIQEALEICASQQCGKIILRPWEDLTRLVR